MFKYDWEFVAAPDSESVFTPFSDNFARDAELPLGIAEAQIADLQLNASFPGLPAASEAAGHIPADPFFTDAAGAFVVSEDFSLDQLVDGPAPQAVAAAEGGLGGADLIFLDSAPFARGGIPGPNGGGKGGGGEDAPTDPGILSEYTSGADGGYNITIDFKGEWSSDLQQAFLDSADRLSETITGDISDVFFRGKIIDDIVISAELKAIDGEGGILGQAGPTAIRTDGYLPATAIMQFDSADAAALNTDGLWDEVIMHEMLHSVGFGTVWDYQGLVAGSGTDSPLFTGESATMTYDFLTEGDQSAGVPLEQDGGPGTAEGHWDEETFGDALMTGWLDSTTTATLSDMTVASLEDLGYDTVWAPDPFTGTS